MAEQLKRQILRQAIDENVSSIEGRAPSRSATGSSHRRGALLLALVPLTAGLLFVLLRPTPPSKAAVDTSHAESTQSVLPEPASPVQDASVDLTNHLRFGAPRPIDPSVFPLEVRSIVLDPGHGGEDHGTMSAHSSGSAAAHGLSEKDLTLDISNRLRERLEADGFRVTLTREADTFISLKDRAEMANGLGADLFVSIHINWLSTRQVRGIETYYLGPTEDPELIALARRENQESGYSLAEMRSILDRLYTDILQQQSHDLADRVQRSLFTSLKRVNPELKNRGVKTAPFVVLVSTEMPAILAEVACLSNDDEVELLSRPLYRDHIADALARGIRGYADDVHQTEEKGS